MNIASSFITPTSYFSPMSPTSASASSSSSSTLSNSDRSFIEFTRCLYKAKRVVQELQAFSKTVGPTLCLSPFAQEQHYDPRITTDEFIQHVNQYLEESFRKFNHMFKILLIVLTKLESNHPVRRERINSFRQEVILEWRKAINIRQDLLRLIQKKEECKIIPSPTSNSSTSSSSSMIESDDEQDDSDTSLEPTTSSDSSSS